MITRARFRNFKALRDVEITFDSRLTVVVGPNGSGKTSILQGIHALSAVFQPKQSPFGTYDVGQLVPCVTAGVGIDTFSLEAEIRGAAANLLVEILPTSVLPKPRRQHVGNAVLGALGLWLDDDPEPNRQPPTSEDIAREFGASVFLRLEPNKLAAPAPPNGVPPTVQPDGIGLAAMLAYQRLNQPERFEEILAAFKRVIPSVDRLRFDKVQNAGFNDVLLFDYTGAKGVRAEHVSTGTLLTLGLFAVTLGPRQPRLILLDDLDHGLHPKAQMDLIEVLRKLLEQYPDIQIIATSHSPYILNQLAWNEVLVTGLNDDGSATCVRLEQHPEIERWREAMTPGEFWSHIGDDWVKKLGNPQPATVAP